MTDLFNTPTTKYSSAFEDFWEKSGKHGNKKAASKAYNKLPIAKRRIAFDSVDGYYKWWRKEYPQASWLHVSTYLNGECWEDEWKPAPAPAQQTQEDAIARAVENIKSGKPYLCTGIQHSLCKHLLERGLVTREELSAVGK